jgi:hypothetical protein
VVFCGECGTPIAQAQGERASSPSSSGDRVARLPPPTPPPPRPAADESVAVVPTKAIGGAKPDFSRASRPSDPFPADARRTAVGLNVRPTLAMPAVIPPAAGAPQPPPERDPRPPKGAGRRRKSLPAIHVEPQGQEETQRILEDLDAGFDSIVRPSELPVPPASAPASARMTAPMGIELFEPPSTNKEPAAARRSAEPPAPPADDAPAIEVTPADGTSAPPEEAAPISLADSLSFLDAPRAPEPEDPAAKAARHEADMAAARALFSEMAVGHARPLRDFMIEVAWGEPSKDWLEVATPAVTGLRRMSEQLEMPALVEALDGVAAALELAAGEATIHREMKEMIGGAYNKLVEMMPAAFALDRERGQREPIIVRSLLLQVPGVQKVALDRIYAAGLTSLGMLYTARAKDLAEATGVDEAIAAAIVDKVQAHRRAMAELLPGKERANERAALAALVADLERAHAGYEQAAKAWGPDAAARKAALRKEREDVVLRIDVALAHLGEVDRQRALQKLPFSQKIQELHRYLQESRP